VTCAFDICHGRPVTHGTTLRGRRETPSVL
jgi:hypothetical protein